MNKVFPFFLLFFILYIAFYILHIPLAFAAVGQAPSQEYHLGEILGEAIQDEFNQQGYTARPGFGYINSTVPFSFRVTDLTIDFGILSPQAPALQSNQLIISTGSVGGWQVLAFQDHPPAKFF